MRLLFDLFGINRALSRDRWLHADGYNPDWAERAKLASKFVPPGSSVVDLGCGQMAVRNYLPAGCSYTPADLTKWTDDVYEIDLDGGIFPPGSYDCALMLGVIEYLKTPDPALTWARTHCNRLVTTYLHPLSPPRRHIRANLFSEDEFRTALDRSGWSVSETTIYQESRKSRHLVYSCNHAP